MAATVFENGTIHTLDPAAPLAQALVAEGGRIVAIGDLAHCRDVAGPGRRSVDLGGLTVLPGLTDSHIHCAQYARLRNQADLRGAANLGECLDRVAWKAATLPPGAWVGGGRWDFHKWDLPVPPTRHDLDRICPDRPVALPSVDGHSWWVNSVALRLSGVDAQTPDPAGGQIVRDIQGVPTGVLKEAAIHPVRDAMARADRGDLASALRQAVQELLRVGLTSVHDIDGDDCRDAFEALYQAGELPIRVHKFIPASGLDRAIAAGRRTGDGDEWLRTGPVKLFSDGALGSHTCWMSLPFAGEPGNHGIAVLEPDEFDALVAKAAAAGIAVAAHAIGDAANAMVLRALARHRTPGLRHRVEHAQHLHPADIALFQQHGIIASMQPVHCTSDIPLVDGMLRDRDLASYAWQSLRSTGAVVAFGSDAPVEDPNPLHGIHAAVTRQLPGGQPPGGFQPHERLTLEQALRAYTTAPAYTSYEEKTKGHLAVGRLADFIALAEDPFSTEPGALHQIAPAMTVVGGVIRWRAASGAR